MFELIGGGLAGAALVYHARRLAFTSLFFTGRGERLDPY